MARDPEEVREMELDRLDIEDRNDDARQEIANAGQDGERRQNEDDVNAEEVGGADFIPQDNAVDHSEPQLYESSDEHLTEVRCL